MSIRCLTAGEIPTLFHTRYLLQLADRRPLSADLHSHAFFEWIAVLGGSCRHEYNTEVQTLSSGHLLLLRPGDTHRFLSQTADTAVMALSVTADEAEPFWQAYGLQGLLSQPPRPVRMPPAECALIRQRCTEAQTLPSPERARMMMGYLTNAFVHGLGDSVRTMPPDLRQLLLEMQKPEHLREGLPAFLRLSHFSHGHLCRLTAQHLHQTPVEYITVMRLQYVAECLQSTDRPVETLAAEAGFSGFSYFYRKFKEQYGETPAAFRRRRRTL